MPDQDIESVQALLAEAVRKAESLQSRLEAGEEVGEDEMSRIAQEVAGAIEGANSKLRELVGDIDTALLRERIVERMTSEEFDQWSKDNASLQEHRARREQGADNG